MKLCPIYLNTTEKPQFLASGEELMQRPVEAQSDTCAQAASDSGISSPYFLLLPQLAGC